MTENLNLHTDPNNSLFPVKISRKVEEILFQGYKTEKPYEWCFEVRAKQVLQISHEQRFLTVFLSSKRISSVFWFF